MDNLKELIEIDWWYVFVAVILFLVVVKFVWSLLEWFLFDKLGIETKGMKQKREDHELLIKTSQNLALLQEKHEKDNDVSEKHDDELKELITDFIQDTRAQMDKIAYDRINDREKSREIRADLAGTIKIIAEANEKNGQQIKELTDLFIDKEINDYRWEIINVADEISNGKFVSKERLKHAISTHSKYEEIIEKYNLTNGEVEISIQVINEAYKKKLLENAK